MPKSTTPPSPPKVKKTKSTTKKEKDFIDDHTPPPPKVKPSTKKVDLPPKPTRIKHKDVCVRILTKKCINNNGEKAREVIEIAAPCKEEFPEGFFNGCNLKRCTYDNNKVFYVDGSTVFVGEIISEVKFAEILSDIKLCLDEMRSRLKEREELEKTWKGSETFSF